MMIQLGMGGMMLYKSWGKPIREHGRTIAPWERSRRKHSWNPGGKRGRRSKKGDCCCCAAFPVILLVMGGFAAILWLAF